MIFSGDVCGSVSNDTLIASARQEIAVREQDLGRSLTEDEKLDLAVQRFLEKNR